jgi:hypothetical protein
MSPCKPFLVILLVMSVLGGLHILTGYIVIKKQIPPRLGVVGLIAVILILTEIFGPWIFQRW